MLAVNQLNQFYGESHTLWDLSFTVMQGHCTSMLGRNGVGKTTLLQCLMGLLPLRSGQILFDGKDLAHERADARAPLGIGYVPQGRQIFPLLTVEENIKTGLFASRATDASMLDLIDELFPVLDEMKKRRGGDLSGGQQQQLAIARALILQPQLLILDEPTEGIQPTIVQEIGDVIQRLNHELNITVLLVEQKLPFARRVSSDYLVLDRGRLVAGGPINQLNAAQIKQYLSV